MTQALLWTNAQLLEAQEWAQEANQRTQEIMALIGQQWARIFGSN